MWHSYSHLERTWTRAQTDLSLNPSASLDHSVALDKFLIYLHLAVSSSTRTQYYPSHRISLKYKWHLTPILEYSPSRVPSLRLLLTGQLMVLLGSPIPEVVNSKPLQHHLSHTAVFFFFTFKYLLMIEQEIPSWWSPNQIKLYQFFTTHPWGPSHLYYGDI